MGEQQRVQLFDFPSCSFEASTLNRKKKNNPLCQPFVAQTLLFPPKSKEDGQDSFCPESICVFYIRLGFEVLIVKWQKRQKFLSNLRKPKGAFLKLSNLPQNSPGWSLLVGVSFATELSMEISTGSEKVKIRPGQKETSLKANQYILIKTGEPDLWGLGIRSGPLLVGSQPRDVHLRDTGLVSGLV